MDPGLPKVVAFKKQGIPGGSLGFKQKLRAFLVLGRISNLPTVWSNCLAGWLIAGGGLTEFFLTLCASASCFYIGGMYMNDACDAEFDRQFRKERPIPSGIVSVRLVWGLTVVWFVSGLSLAAFLGRPTLLMSIIMLGFIVPYDLIHKYVKFSPWIMAVCRLVLYLTAATAGSGWAGDRGGFLGQLVWSSVALAVYIIGLSYLARLESSRQPVLKAWPCLLLGGPILLSVFFNGGSFRITGLVFAAICGVWIVWCLRNVFRRSAPQVGKTVGGLLAGIVLVDALAIAQTDLLMNGLLVVLFLSALLLQKVIPAT
ncbi:MAG: UbiA family prenyltransferase [Nitrospinaceae bacterium]|nr:UbiA family prenyltransferase [Nitrospinaceae bacterium]